MLSSSASASIGISAGKEHQFQSTPKTPALRKQYRRSGRSLFRARLSGEHLCPVGRHCISDIHRPAYQLAVKPCSTVWHGPEPHLRSGESLLASTVVLALFRRLSESGASQRG